MGVLQVLIVRSHDGLALAGSTDISHDPVLLASKRYMKMACRRAQLLPDRCLLRISPHVLYFIRALGIAFISLCSEDFPPVLAFSFLDEIQKEFLLEYDNRKLDRIVRPYTLIEFDAHVQKAKQRYNISRNQLITRINLHDMEVELTQRPPVELSMEDIGLKSAMSNGILPTCTGSDVLPQLEPMTVLNVASLVLSSLSLLLTVIRTLSIVSADTGNTDGTAIAHAFLFICAGVLTTSQMFLTCRNTEYRHTKSVLFLTMLTVTNLLLGSLRNVWQTLYHVLTSAVGFWSVHTRRELPQEKYRSV